MPRRRSPNLILLHGQILTMDVPGQVQGMALSGDRILALGSDSQIKGLADKTTEIIDLGGRTVLPGFIDAHTHLVSTGLMETIHLDLAQAGTLEELLEIVRAAAGERAPGEWLIGRRWEESRWPEQRYVAREDLDRAAPGNPAALARVDGHLLCVNSKALEQIQLPEKFGDRADLERGLLWEEAAWWFNDRITPEVEEIKRAIEAATKLAHSLGVTSVHDIVKPAYLEAYQKLHATGRLKLRVYFNLKVEHARQLIDTGLVTGFGNDWLRLGAVKLFADGSIGAGNAALSKPYCDRRGRGQLNYDEQELFPIVNRAHEQGWQVMAHAIGDRAIEAVLGAYERTGIEPEDRYRIEHFELARDEHLERAANLGIVASMQPNFLQWVGSGGMYQARLGEERTGRATPHRLVLDAGIKLACGSDCMPFSPLFGIHQAVNAPHPAQRLTVEEALRCYTRGGAHASFEEELKGSLAPGRLADFIVLSADPFQRPEGIENIKVEMTYLGGKLVFSRSG